MKEYIFFSNATHVSYVSVDGGESKAVFPAESATLGFDGTNRKLWYFNTENLTLYNSNLDGSNKQAVFKSSDIGYFTVNGVNETVYYLHKNDDNRVRSLTFTGSELPIINVLQDTDFRDIQVDPSNQ